MILQMMGINAVLLVLIIGIIIFIIVTFNKTLLKPIKEFTHIINKMANNDFTTTQIESLRIQRRLMIVDWFQKKDFLR